MYMRTEFHRFHHRRVDGSLQLYEVNVTTVPSGTLLLFLL